MTYKHTHNCIHVEPFVHEAVSVLSSLEARYSASFVDDLPTEFTYSIGIEELGRGTRTPTPPVVVILGTKDPTLERVVYSGQHFQLNFVVRCINVLHLKQQQQSEEIR